MRRAILLVVILAATASASAASRRPFELRCPGLGKYEIVGTFNIDWAWGTFRSRGDDYAVSFTAGGMTTPLVPSERPPGFKWVKTETIGDVVVRYGLNARAKQMQATIFGGPLLQFMNLVGSPKSERRFEELVRALPNTRCRTVWR